MEEQILMMEAANGTVVRVPQSKLGTWQVEQSSAETTLTSEEQRLRDRILRDIYSSKK